MDEDLLSPPRNDNVSLARLCRPAAQYEQIQGFMTGSPLAAILVQLFMETLEIDHS